MIDENQWKHWWNVVMLQRITELAGAIVSFDPKPIPVRHFLVKLADNLVERLKHIIKT